MRPAPAPAGLLASLALTCAACGSAPPATSPSAAPALVGVPRIQADAAALGPLVQAPLTRAFLAATARLPRIAPRQLYRSTDKTRAFTEAEAAQLPPDEHATLTPLAVDEDLYYTTYFGSPLSYIRPLEVLAARGVTLGPGSKLLDFGYGYVSHLRLLASLGIAATGIDVAPLLRALYAAPGDQGAVAGDGVSGQLRLLDGHFPAAPATVAAVGSGYDVIVSKNVLKKGYVHPDRPADPKFLLDLGAPDEVVLAAFYRALAPGGVMLVYNICPAPTAPDKPFVPWSDGRSPFSRTAWEAAGFEVLAFDVDDTAATRQMARVLGWGDDPEDPWDLDHDLSVLWTLVKRPR